MSVSLPDLDLKNVGSFFFFTPVLQETPIILLQSYSFQQVIAFTSPVLKLNFPEWWNGRGDPTHWPAR
jgi:hypothetical protein